MIRRFATVPMVLGALAVASFASPAASQESPQRSGVAKMAWSGEAQQLPDRTQAVGSIAAISASGMTVAAVAGYSLLVWDAGTGRLAREINIMGHQAGTSTVAISRDGRRIALAGPARESVADGLLPNQTRMPRTTEGAVINVWEAETGRLVSSIEPPKFPNRICFGAATYEFAAILPSIDSSLANETVNAVFSLKSSDIWKPRPVCKAGASEVYTLTIWGDDGRQVTSMAIPRNVVRNSINPLERGMAFSRDLRRAVALGELEATLYLCDVGQSRARAVGYFSKIEPPACIALSPDGRTVALMSHGNALSLWDFDSGSLLRVDPKAPPPGVSPDNPSYLGFDPDGRRIISGGHEGGLRIWDAATAELRQTIQGPKAMIRDIAFLPGGRLRIVSGGWWQRGMDPVLKVWDVAPAPGP